MWKKWIETKDTEKVAVITMKLAYPKRSYKRIAEELGKRWIKISKNTVWSIIRRASELFPTKSEALARVLNNDKKLLKLWSNISVLKLKKLAKDIKDNDGNLELITLTDIKTIWDILDKAQKRIWLLWGDLTNDEWGYKMWKESENLLNKIITE